jgi:hypothetical protein
LYLFVLLTANTDAPYNSPSKALNSARVKIRRRAVELAKLYSSEKCLQRAIDTWWSASYERFSSFIGRRAERQAVVDAQDVEIAELRQEIESRMVVKRDLSSKLQALEIEICDLDLKVLERVAVYSQKKSDIESHLVGDGKGNIKSTDLSDSKSGCQANTKTRLDELLLRSKYLDAAIQALEKDLRPFSSGEETAVRESSTLTELPVLVGTCAATSSSSPALSIDAGRNFGEIEPFPKIVSSNSVQPGPSSAALYAARPKGIFSSVPGAISLDVTEPPSNLTDSPPLPAHLLKRKLEEAGSLDMSSYLPKRPKPKVSNDSAFLCRATSPLPRSVKVEPNV